MVHCFITRINRYPPANVTTTLTFVNVDNRLAKLKIRACVSSISLEILYIFTRKTVTSQTYLYVSFDFKNTPRYSDNNLLNR